MTRTLAAVVVALAVLVTACTDEPQPRRADPTTSPPTSEPTETTPPPTPPSPDPEALSPEDTVRAWVEARNKLLSTGDADAVEGLSSVECTTCLDINEGVAEVYENGGYFRTEGWSVGGAKRSKRFQRDRVVNAAIVFAAGVTVIREGARPRRYDEEKNFIEFTLTSREGRWLVDRMVFLT